MRARRRVSLRARITLVATLGIAVALSALAFGLGQRLHSDLVRQLDRQLDADAKLIASRSATPTARNLSNGPPDRLAQVVDPRGAVVTTSANTTTPIVPGTWPWPVGSGVHFASRVDPARGHLRVLATPIGPHGDQWLVVARSQDLVVHSTESTTRGLLVAVPLLTVVLGAVIWFVVGRALRPVEALRRSVSDMTEHDLTARLALPRTGDELDRLATTLNDMLARLEGANRRERQLVADASHELRSPVAAVRALVETRALAGPDAAAQDAQTLAAIQRLQTLVDQLLELAAHDRLETAPVQAVDLDDVVLQQAELLRRTTTLTVDTSAVSAGQVVGSEEALGRLVENLASNAARHARSAVRFAVYETPDEGALVVADDGPGIPAGERERVFERFVRLDDARSADRAGAGLGLAIVAGIVERHRGAVTADADPILGGARVTVHLPLGDDLTGTPSPRLAAAAATACGSGTGQAVTPRPSPTGRTWRRHPRGPRPVLHQRAPDPGRHGGSG